LIYRGIKPTLSIPFVLEGNGHHANRIIDRLFSHILTLCIVAAINVEDGLHRESGVMFHKIGISNEDKDHGFKNWKMRTLSKFI